MLYALVISHSETLAREIVAFCAAMLPPNEKLTLSAVGGTDDGTFGNSFTKIKTAVLNLTAAEHIFIIADMGSAILTTQAVLATPELAGVSYTFLNAPLLEGTFLLYATANGTQSLAELKQLCEAKFDKGL